MLDRLLFEHPRSVGESYGEHLLVAGGFGLSMIAAGFACMVHALVPCLFGRTGSSTIAHLHERMIHNRRRMGVSAEAGIVSDGSDAG